MSDTAPIASVLTDQLIARWGERADDDRENCFIAENFEELKRVGYLKASIPRELGGLGMSLPEVCHEQRRLAYRAPATALAINMHLTWMGVAADLFRLGDTSLRWMLDEGAAGEVFAAEHGEPDNDLPLLYSTATAERIDGGYRLTGRKRIGCRLPIWTRLGIHAQDRSDPACPKIVHAFMAPGTPGYHVDDTRDAVCRTATCGDDMVLEGAFVQDGYVGRVVPADFAGADLFVLAIFVWAEPTFGSIYLGLAQRALDLSIESVKAKRSIAYMSRTMAYHPEVQHNVAEMVLALDAATALVERVAEDWSNGVDHGRLWPSKVVSARYIAAETAKRIVDRALDVDGDSGTSERNELEQLYRDVRATKIPSASSMLVHEIVGKSALGVLGEYPRWG
jgi:alkylation response protein AidB-like acyl-CoA dehydrogenase